VWRIVHDPLGDYNLDGLINQDDYGLWRSTFGQVGANLAADGNRDGIVDAADYAVWRSRNRSIVIILPTPGLAAAESSIDVDDSDVIDHLGARLLIEQIFANWPSRSPVIPAVTEEISRPLAEPITESVVERSLLLLERSAYSPPRRDTPDGTQTRRWDVEEVELLSLDELFVAAIDAEEP
jgi:hypothetical protein